VDTCNDQVALAELEDKQISRHTQCSMANLTVNAFQLLAEKKHFSFYKNSRLALERPQTSYSMGTWR